MASGQLKYLWEIANSPYESPFLAQSEKFGTTEPVFLVDQYAGRRPVLLNQKFFAGGRLEIKMVPTIVLDSNMLDAIEKRVLGDVRKDGLEDFLRFVVAKGWDYNAFFYYLEHLAKADDRDFVKHASRRTLALLRLHSMDEEIFLSSGQIIESREAVESYLSSANASTLEEVAIKRVTAFSMKYQRDDVNSIIENTRISLIKMILINKVEIQKASVKDKQDAFLSFLKNDLGLILGREAHLALHYFSGAAGKLVGVESSMSFEKALSKISSTAWDMFLLRFQEMLFTDESEEVCVGYIATQEKSLDNLARLFTIERIECGDSGHILPQVSYDVSALPKNIQASSAPLVRPSSADRLARPPGELRIELESQLSRYCT